MNRNTMSSLSKTEVELVARLSYEEKDIVTAKELDSYLPSSFSYRNQLVYSLKKKRVLIPIKSGVYIFVPLDAVPTGRRACVDEPSGFGKRKCAVCRCVQDIGRACIHRIHVQAQRPGLGNGACIGCNGPSQLRRKPGQGRQLRETLHRLVRGMKASLPRGVIVILSAARKLLGIGVHPIGQCGDEGRCIRSGYAHLVQQGPEG